MPNQGFLRVMQIKTEMLWRVRRHNERWREMPEDMKPNAPHIKIDWPMTDQNVVWRGAVPDEPEDGRLELPRPVAWKEDEDTLRERAERRIAEIDEFRMANGMRRMRHGDATWHIATEFVVGAADYMKRSTREQQIEFLKGACRWLAEKYGASNFFSVTFHFDEPDGQPHAHIVLVPENLKTHTVSASSVFTRGSLVRLQAEMYDGYFSKFGLDRHHHYEEGEVKPKHQTKQLWLERRQLEAERDAAIAERDAAIAEWEDAERMAQDAKDAAAQAKTSRKKAERAAAKARSAAEKAEKRAAEAERKASDAEGRLSEAETSLAEAEEKAANARKSAESAEKKRIDEERGAEEARTLLEARREAVARYAQSLRRTLRARKNAAEKVDEANAEFDRLVAGNKKVARQLADAVKGRRQYEDCKSLDDILRRIDRHWHATLDGIARRHREAASPHDREFFGRMLANAQRAMQDEAERVAQAFPRTFTVKIEKGGGDYIGKELTVSDLVPAGDVGEVPDVPDVPDRDMDERQEENGAPRGSAGLDL